MLKIREVEERDLDRLKTIINEPDIIRYMPLEKPVGLERLRRWYQSFRLFKRPSIFVLETDKVIGACSIYEDGKITIWIDRDYQRKGYGAKAIIYLKKYAVKNNIPRLWCDCFKDNKQALAFYEKIGFERMGQRDNSYLLEMKI